MEYPHICDLQHLEMYIVVYLCCKVYRFIQIENTRGLLLCFSLVFTEHLAIETPLFQVITLASHFHSMRVSTFVFLLNLHVLTLVLGF